MPYTLDQEVRYFFCVRSHMNSCSTPTMEMKTYQKRQNRGIKDNEIIVLENISI